MSPPPVEPPVDSWRVQSLSSFARALTDAAGATPQRPQVVAIDGRGGSGKTTLAERIHATIPGSAVVHTDDVAWHDSFFDWVDPLVRGVLEPIHQNQAVNYQPTPWRERSRPGAIPSHRSARWFS